MSGGAGLGVLKERIELGQILVGSPDTVLSQMRRIQHEVGVGVFEVIFSTGEQEKSRRSIELFADKVLPRMREM